MSLTASEMTPADFAAVTNNNGGDGFFGGNGWWIILLFLFIGWGGRGFGGGFGGNGGGGGCDCRTAIDYQGIVGKLDGLTNGLSDATYALNNTINNGFHGVDNAVCGLSRQLSDCCCTTQRAIDGINYNLATGLCDVKTAMNDNTRAILDFLTQDKIATLTAENQSLKFAASQNAQNALINASLDAQSAELIRRLGRDCPVPAYVVPNPNCCTNSCGF